MKLEKSFVIEKPAATVPWDINEEQLKTLFPTENLRWVAQAYYTLPVTVLGGLECMVGFHFRGTQGGLSELEFFRSRTAYPGQRESFEEFQKYFERTFGPPTHTKPGIEGFPSHEWRFSEVSIAHYIFNRFGPEEHLRIRYKQGSLMSRLWRTLSGLEKD